MRISQVFLSCLSIGFLLLCLAYSSCTTVEPITPSGNQKAMIQIYLTDDPGDYDQVNIDLQEVWVKMTDSSSTDFYALQTNQGIYDLLQLQNGLDTLIVTDSLPPGEAQEIRLVLGEDNSIMVDSVLQDLKVPSGQQSGLKIKLNKILVEDSISSVTLDFDAGESVVEKGNGSYSLKPVIRVLD